jgi:quercetin 2,3-dioxygenase
MTAGRGIIHRELAFLNERAHILQLWVNLPADRKLVANRYQDLRAADRPVIERDGARLEVISGDVDGTSGPALNHWPISGTLITLEPDRRIDHLLPGADRAFFSVLAGEVTIAGKGVRAGDTAWSDPVPGAAVSVIELATARADATSVVVAYSGQPIGEPVVMGGPFVMNTPAEITNAFEDFRSGKFGEVPKQARLQYL